jgi:lipid A 3-O-deacylase
LFFKIITGYSQTDQKTDTVIFNDRYKYTVEIGAEYLVPTHFSDKINTVSMHSYFWKQYFKNIYLKINVGLTSTYAWGYTTQYKVKSDTLFITHYKTSGFGMGPAVQIDFAPIKIKRFSMVVEASGSFVLYTNHFPYGGDIYNFMFRAGPSLLYKINKECMFKIGYRWMHVSNGQGRGDQNPFYEAQGINVGMVIVK